MRKVLYNLIYELGNAEVGIVAFTGKFIIQTIGHISNFLIMIIAYVNNIGLLLIDSERYNHAVALSDQYESISELEVIRRAIMVKDDAIENGDWTEDHTKMINSLSSELYNNCDWSQQKIHQYMKSLVEMVPGVTYVCSGNDAVDEQDQDDDDDYEFSQT